MGILFTILMGFLFTITMGILFTIVLGIQFTISTEAIEYCFGIVDRVPQTIQLLSDNGPAYIAHETRNFARTMGLEVCTIPNYSPESNGMAEAFIKTFKRDYVHMNELPYAITVMEKLPLWFED